MDAAAVAQASKKPCKVSTCLIRMSRYVSISASFSLSPRPLRKLEAEAVEKLFEVNETALP